ncbi:hypothetical protein [Sporosarcina sp. FSL K6-2383]|uniref:hypothetical protein n=1 Tax=Sporosarcina sp. FSL K6-2383 TaxID=2921556 RepID=UPI003159EB97
MTDADLNLANEIKKDIRELERFLLSAEKVWTGKLIKKTSKYIFRSSAYGMFHEADYFMNTEIKNKVLDVLRDELTELRNRLKEI